MSAPTLVQYNDTATSVTSIAFLSDVTEGDMLILMGMGAFAPSEMTDNLGNTYVPAMMNIAGPLPQAIPVYVCPSSIGSGACTVTGFDAQSHTGLLVAEFSPSVFQAMSGLANGGTSSTFAGAANQLLVGLCQAVSPSTITGVGAGFTREAIHDASVISLEYKTLSAASSVGSVFTTSGVAALIGTYGFTLSAPAIPVANTPSVIQVTSDSEIPNPITARDSILYIVEAYASTNALMGPPSDQLGNTYVPVPGMSGAIATGQGGSEAYLIFGAWFCQSSKGGRILDVGPALPSGATILGNAFFELSPCTITASSGVASSSMSASNMVSSAIAAVSGQLLVSFSASNFNFGSSEGSIGLPCEGFQLALPWFGDGLQVSTQPVVASGNYNASTSTCSFGPFASVFQTGVFGLTTAYSISGNISGPGAANATITYTGTASGSVTADGSGNYSISGLSNGNYYLTPSGTPGVEYSPTTAVTVDNFDVTQNFTSFQPTRFVYKQDLSAYPGAPFAPYVVLDGGAKQVGLIIWDNVMGYFSFVQTITGSSFNISLGTDVQALVSFINSLTSPGQTFDLLDGRTPVFSRQGAQYVESEGSINPHYVIFADAQETVMVGVIRYDPVNNRFTYVPASGTSTVNTNANITKTNLGSMPIGIYPCGPQWATAIQNFISGLSLPNPQQSFTL